MNQLMTQTAEPLPAFLFAESEDDKIIFEVNSEERASWAANKILAAQRRIEIREGLAAKYKARVDEWLEAANQADLASMDSLKGLVGYWLAKTLTGQGKTRSIKVLGATIGFRKKPDRVEIMNPDLSLRYCEEKLPEAVVVKKDLSKTILKAFLSNGTQVPGCNLVHGEDELSVKGV